MTVTFGGLTETSMFKVPAFSLLSLTPPPELIPFAILKFRSMENFGSFALLLTAVQAYVPRQRPSGEAGEVDATRPWLKTARNALRPVLKKRSGLPSLKLPSTFKGPADIELVELEITQLK